MFGRKVVLFYILFNINSAFFMGGSNEPHEDEYKNESELAKDQPNICATAFYADGSEVKIEGLNINGKAKLKNVFLKRKKATIPSNVLLKNVKEFEFNGTEGTSLLLKVSYKSGSTEEYLANSNLKFCGWVQKTEHGSTCTLPAKELKKLTLDGFQVEKAATRKSSAKNLPALKNILDADKDEPIAKKAPKPNNKKAKIDAETAASKTETKDGLIFVEEAEEEETAAAA